MSCDVGHRCGLDPMLLWLWRRLAATAPIGPLAWEPPCAAGAALEKDQKTNKQTKTACVCVSVCLPRIHLNSVEFMWLSAASPVRPLDWELSYAEGVALKEEIVMKYNF